jgi:hypothetical protein
MGTDGGAIDTDHLPVDVARGIGVELEGLEDAFPAALSLPTKQAVVAGAPGAVALGQIAPGGTGAQHPENAVEHQAMIVVLAAALALGGGQQGSQAFPFLIGKVGACHSGQILPR